MAKSVIPQVLMKQKSPHTNSEVKGRCQSSHLKHSVPNCQLIEYRMALFLTHLASVHLDGMCLCDLSEGVEQIVMSFFFGREILAVKVCLFLRKCCFSLTLQLNSRSWTGFLQVFYVSISHCEKFTAHSTYLKSSKSSQVTSFPGILFLALKVKKEPSKGCSWTLFLRDGFIFF